MSRPTHSLFAINDAGRVIGEDHPNAKLTDREVELMRTMHEQGAGLTELARGFEVQKKTVWKIVTYRARAQTIAGHRRKPNA